ncbi:hypothetical protein HGM15179_018617 [Zosterops borbonicus]|uniref:ribonuclease H n=1 Tax=Zosterops borbonicus TaxID=364589 RepID=A0A8K1FYH0_9PASS|nr:hypothetical protein HGM15179_018617 [Zosterops borbonicus]
MQDSATICHWYVAKTLSPVQERMPDVLFYYYMDDILISAETVVHVEEAVQAVCQAVTSVGLTIASEKVQKKSPWKYLGWRIGMHSILAQPFQISTEIRTLHDPQKLLGTINWVRPLLGILNADLEPLFALLEGEPDLLSPRHLNKEAQIALQKVADALSQRQSAQWAPELPLWLIILNCSRQPHVLIFQWDSEKTDPPLIIKWVFLPNNMPKTISMQDELMAMLIIKARQRLTSLAGKDFDRIYLPLTVFYLNWLLQMSEKLQIALADYPGQISIHLPEHKLLSSSFNLLPKPKRSETPLRAMTIFTDGSGKTHKSVIVWKDSETGAWQSDIAVAEGSPQIVELAAVVRVFQKFNTPFDLVTDSAFVSGIAHRAENSLLVQRKGGAGDAPAERLCKALYVSNFLNCSMTTSIAISAKWSADKTTECLIFGWSLNNLKKGQKGDKLKGSPFFLATT